MSITDELIVRYFELVTPVPIEEVRQIRDDMASGKLNPRDAKMRLARELVTMFHGKEAALNAEKEFIAVFQKGALPDDIPEVVVPKSEMGDDGTIWLPKLLTAAGLTNSTSAGKRSIIQGAVRVDGEKITDPDHRVLVTDGMVVQIGKRKFARIKL